MADLNRARLSSSVSAHDDGEAIRVDGRPVTADDGFDNFLLHMSMADKGIAVQKDTETDDPIILRGPSFEPPSSPKSLSKIRQDLDGHAQESFPDGVQRLPPTTSNTRPVGIVVSHHDDMRRTETSRAAAREGIKPEQFLAEVVKQCAGRPDVNFAPLDMSCSFSVSDARQPDLPIIYCSPAFERTTKYTLDEIRGHNHRFLQNPSGRQEAGIVRQFTDNNAISQMMQKLSIGTDSQVTLLNYTKDGQPWMNLLTMIPLSSELNTVDYVVGFQIDVMQHPQNILARRLDGSYKVDYRTVGFPRSVQIADSGPQRSTLEEILGMSSSPPVASAWNSFLLQNISNVVISVSLKGIVLSCSPSISAVLGYSTQALVGQPFAKICHPSDLMPLMRELRDSEVANHGMNILVRLRNRASVYTWMEFLGKSHVENGRGTKTIIMSGRPRALMNLQYSVADLTTGVGSNTFWLRLSLNGTILFSTSGAAQLLGPARAQLIGVNMGALLDEMDIPAYHHLLDVVRNGSTGMLKHKYVQKYPVYGKVLNLVSMFYPSLETDLTTAFVLVRMTSSSATTSSPVRPTRRVVQTRHSDSIVTRSTINKAKKPLRTGDKLSLAPVPADLGICHELDAKRNSSWQYELHQLRLTNKRLREEVSKVRMKKVS